MFSILSNPCMGFGVDFGFKSSGLWMVFRRHKCFSLMGEFENLNGGKRESRTEGLGNFKQSVLGFWGMGIKGLGFGVRTEELEEPSFSARALAACTAHPSASEHVQERAFY